MNENVCPVVATIHEIRGGGLYVDDAEESRDRIIRIGGSEIEYVMNDTAYYVMTRKIELARFELTRPSAEACKTKYKKMFSDLVGMTNDTLRMYIIDRAFGRKYVHEQFVKLVDLIGKIEELIVEKVNILSTQSAAANISLPDIVFLPRIDQHIVYNPAALEDTINKIIDYVNKININSILPAPIPRKIENVEKFTVPDIAVDEPISKSTARTPEEYLSDMKKIIERESLVAKHVDAIEKYHCDVINHMSQIYSICVLFVDGLASTGRRI